jgi:epsilon-lactone hydrolase
MTITKPLVLASCAFALALSVNAPARTSWAADPASPAPTGAAAETKPAQVGTPFPQMPSVSVEADGTVHFTDRAIPLPTLMSPEAKAKYIEIINRSLALQGLTRQQLVQNMMQGAPAGLKAMTDAALKVFPSAEEDTEIGGVKVSIFTPSDIPARNRHRVVMMFNADPVGVSLAAVGRMKVIAVHYMPTQPRGSTEIVAVYRELLKTHKPSQIAMVGLSGGCQYAANTAMWLPSQNLPFPGAMGLLTCAGGAAPGDTRTTLDGLDPQLSSYTVEAALRGGRGPGGQRSAPKPGEPLSEVLDTPEIPKGFPPSYLMAGTRDMCLSETVVLHRKLKHAGVVTELNIFEGMWHGFNLEPGLPETRDAAADIASFLDRHLGT